MLAVRWRRVGSHFLLLLVQGAPASFIKCTDMVAIGGPFNGACPSTVTSGTQGYAFKAGNLLRDAAFAGTCP